VLGWMNGGFTLLVAFAGLVTSITVGVLNHRNNRKTRLANQAEFSAKWVRIQGDDYASLLLKNIGNAPPA